MKLKIHPERAATNFASLFKFKNIKKE